MAQPGIAGRTPFVGRERELATLLARLEAIPRGQGCVVLVAGEPGIGKTRLLTELAARAPANGWTVLAGRAYDTEGMPPYLPFTEALRDYLRTHPNGPQSPLSQGQAEAELARLMSNQLGRSASLPSGAPTGAELERYHLFEGVCDALDAIARGVETGLLLVLDDLHWADTPSLLLLQHLARRLAGVPVVVLAAYRTSGAEPSPALTATLAALAREGSGPPLLLSPFGLEQTAALAAAIAGAAIAEPVAEAIQRATEGNPFFIGELVRHLLATGHDLNRPDTTVSDTAVPELVRQVIAARLARLHPTTNELLRQAAVLGDGFTWEVVRAASGLEGNAALDALEEALTAGVLRTERDTYHFGHALIRRTVYDALSPPRRQHLHLRAAEAIEALSGGDTARHAAALATHYRRAGAAADPRKVLESALRAAAGAAATFAWEDVVVQHQAAVDLVDAHPDARLLDDAGLCELLLSLGDAQLQAAMDDPAIRTFARAAQAARQLGDAGLLARAALGHQASGRINGGVNHASVGLIEEALRTLAPDELPLRARLLSALADALYWSADPRKLAHSQEAVTLARRSSDVDLLMRTLAARRWVLQSTREFSEERYALASELVRLAGAHGDRVQAEAGLRWRVVDLMELGAIHELRAAVAAHAQLAEELRLPVMRHRSLGFQAMLALSDGRLAEVEPLLRRAEALRQWLPGLLQFVTLRREQGRLDDPELAAIVRSGAERPEAAPHEQVMPAYVAAELGREAEARALWATLARNDFRDVLGSSFSLPVPAMLAQVCAMLADRERAAVLYELLLPHAARYAVPYSGYISFGAVAHYLGLLARTLGDAETAAGHFDAALTMHERMEARPLLAHTCREYAVTLIDRAAGARNLDRACALLIQALALYDELGMTAFAARTRALLRDPHLASSRRMASESRPSARPDGLTEREVAVLRLVGGGRSNREIADALTISPRTVVHHIEHIYRKIDARNRAAAVAYAVRHGLVEAADPAL